MDMTTGSIPLNILKFSIPLMLAQILEVLFNTGMRVHELCGLKLSDYDEKSGIIKLHTTVTVTMERTGRM